MKYDVELIARDVKDAAQHATQFSTVDDGGTCNFDSCYLRAPRMQEATAKAISAASGVHCFISNSRIYGRIMHIGIGLGKANRRTKMAEEARKFLVDRGLDVGMYYQMD